jgi:hypothetical protein
MDPEIKKLREELGLKYTLNKKYLRPAARGKSGAELVRELRNRLSSN